MTKAEVQRMSGWVMFWSRERVVAGRLVTWWCFDHVRYNVDRDPGDED